MTKCVKRIIKSSIERGLSEKNTPFCSHTISKNRESRDHLSLASILLSQTISSSAFIPSIATPMLLELELAPSAPESARCQTCSPAGFSLQFLNSWHVVGLDNPNAPPTHTRSTTASSAVYSFAKLSNQLASSSTVGRTHGKFASCSAKRLSRSDSVWEVKSLGTCPAISRDISGGKDCKVE